jgi:hypothetical protein
VKPELKKIEIPDKIRNTHPKDNHIRVDLSGKESNASVSICTGGSKTEQHVGASLVAVENSKETHRNSKTKYYTQSFKPNSAV